MDMTFYSKLPASISKTVERLANKDGMSSEEWIVNALINKVNTVENAADFLKRRAGNAQPADLMYFLNRAKNEPPPLGDEIYDS